MWHVLFNNYGSIIYNHNGNNDRNNLHSRITTQMEKDVPSAIRPVPALGRRGRYVDACCRRPAGWGPGAAGGSPRRAAGTSRSLAGHFLDSNSWKVSIKFGS